MNREKTQRLAALVDMWLGQVLREDLLDDTRSNKVGSFCINTEALPSVTVRELNLMLERKLAAVVGK